MQMNKTYAKVIGLNLLILSLYMLANGLRHNDKLILQPR